MPTECNAELFEFTPVGRRAVVAGFDGGAITSDAGAVLLGATDDAIRLVERFADCFIDRRKPELVEHLVATLVGQRVFGIALGYEDISDHDKLRHDPIMAVLAAIERLFVTLFLEAHKAPPPTTTLPHSRAQPSSLRRDLDVPQSYTGGIRPGGH
jgi:Transposase DDE domain group 1